MFASISPKILPLTKYEKYLSDARVSSDEGVIEYLLSVINPEERFCVEFGARDGSGAHVSFLIKNGYSALLLEGNPEAAKRLQENFRDNDRVSTAHAFITRENIEKLFEKYRVPESPAFLLIDMDGNDYHVWKAITRFRPLVVSIEYNPGFAPPEKFVVDYREDFMWSGDDYYGASISSMVDLAKDKGYELIHVSSGGDNLFFVRNDVFNKFGIENNTAENFYQLPQYGKKGRAKNGKGHPVSIINSSPAERIFASLKYWLFSIPRKIVKIRMKQEINRRSGL